MIRISQTVLGKQVNLLVTKLLQNSLYSQQYGSMLILSVLNYKQIIQTSSHSMVITVSHLYILVVQDYFHVQMIMWP